MKIVECQYCEHANKITDGYFLCMRNGIPVCVIDNYEPTKNFWCCKEERKDEGDGYLGKNGK